MNSARERVEWRAVPAVVLVAPLVFMALTALTGSWRTLFWLSICFALVGGTWMVRSSLGGSVTLHLAIAWLVGYQVVLLRSTADTPNVGIVWFLLIPVLVAALGRQVHILIWTPLSMAAISLCWYWTRDQAAMAHPLSLWNLLAAVGCIAAAGYELVAERTRRETKLRAALEQARVLAVANAEAQREAQESAESTSRFLASMSHELRTPMTTILLSSEMLAESLQGAEERMSLQGVQRSAEVLLALINDVLELAKVDAHSVVARREVFELLPLLDEVRLMMAPHFAGKSVRLFVETEPGMAQHFVGDAPRIRQVLLNLVQNAVQHTDTGVVGVFVEPTPKGLRLSVRDTGEGIQPASLAKIFEPFVQLDHGEAPYAPGTGLGLTIAREFVRAMGGEIEVSSQPGEGTCFSFELPIAMEPAPSTASS